MTPRRRLLLILILALAAAPATTAGAQPFRVATSPFTLGQAPDWLDADQVVYHGPGPDGKAQVFRSTLTGAKRACLTCGLDGPNQVPLVQPGARTSAWLASTPMAPAARA